MTKIRDLHAWINAMPPGPRMLLVAGEVQVANPGARPVLTVKEPQGINPQILLLDLHLVQEPGIWPQVQVWQQMRFDKPLSQGAPDYKQVDIFLGEECVASAEVSVAH